MKAIFLALCALVSAASANLEVLAPVAQLPVNFVPQAVAPFSSKDGKLFISGTCSVENLSAPCSLDVVDLKAESVARRHSNLRRALQTNIICDLVNITIGVTEINIAGLIVALPDGLNLDVQGAAGLVGELLCGLLSGTGLLSGILTGIVNGIASVTNLADALTTLVNALNGLPLPL